MFDRLFALAFDFATQNLLQIKRRRLRSASRSDQAGQVGLEPTTPGFGDRCSAKLSYWPLWGIEALTLFRDEADVFGIADSIFLAQVVQDHFDGFFPSCNSSPDMMYIPV